MASKIISFSGTDGSGKTTQVERVFNSLTARNFKVFKGRMFGYFVLTPVVKIFKKSLADNTSFKDNNERIKEKVLRLPRILTYFWFAVTLIDNWLCFFFKILPLKFKYDYILYDRYFTDVGASLYYNHIFSKRIFGLYLRLIPLADFHVIFNLPPEVAYMRSKDKFNNKYYRLQTKIYATFGTFLPNTRLINSLDKIAVIARELTKTITQKRILFVISGIGPPAAGGVSVIYELIKEIAKKGYCCTILTPIYYETPGNWKKWINDESKKYTIKFVTLDAPDWIKIHFTFYHTFSQVRLFFTIFRIRLITKFDVIHEFTSTPLVGLRSSLVSFLTRTRFFLTVSTYHSGILGHYLPLKHMYLEKIIFPTLEQVNLARSLGIKRNRLSHIPFALNLENIRMFNKRVAKRKMRLPENKLTVLYTGPIKKEKGAFQYAKSAGRLSKKYGEVVFVFIASRESGRRDYGKNKDRVMLLLGDQKNIRFLEGFFDINILYSAADIVVVPQQDPHGTIAPPITVLDAMAHGCCVVGTQTSGIKEIISNKITGFLYPKSGLHDLEKILSDLFDDKELILKTGTRAREKVIENDTSVTASTYIKLYEQQARGKDLKYNVVEE